MKVIEFLGMFIPVTLAKRIVCIIVLSVGVIYSLNLQKAWSYDKLRIWHTTIDTE